MVLLTHRQLIFLLISTFISLVSSYPNFDEYVKMFKKNYPNDEIYQWRKSIYQRNIEKFKTITNYIPGVNNFTDLLQQQFKQMLGLKILPQKQRNNSIYPKYSSTPMLRSPVSLDYRDQNIITSVKNQFSCGSCWAFTSAALAESFLVKNKQQDITIDLSQQFMIECTKGNDGCRGGTIQRGLDKINKSCPLEKNFSYKRGWSTYGAKICEAQGIKTNFKRLSFYSLTDNQLIRLLNQGPVAVAVNSDHWKDYRSGIISCYSNIVDHAVLAVGYTNDSIIVKNSWGQTWGQKGYVYVSRNPNRNCGINHQGHILVKQQWQYWNACKIGAILLLLMLVNN